MVLRDYDGMEEMYEGVKQAACGRQACSVMLLVAAEVDAIASARILTKLFRSDNITYKIRPVANYSHIQETVAELTNMDIKIVFMINCGAIYNIPKLFGLDVGGDIRCFIIDNHRPVHLSNVHSNYNVVVLNDGSITENCPSDGSDLSADFGHTSSDNDLDSDDDANEMEGYAQSDLSENESEDDKSDNDNDEFEGSGSDEEENIDARSDSNSIDVSNSNLNNVDADVETDGAQSKSNAEVFGKIEDEDEDDVQIVGKKRKALQNIYDPKKARKRKIRAYYDKDCFSIPTSVMLITLVKSLNRTCNNDVLWQAILGTTDHYQKLHISEQLYNSICDELKKQLPENSFRGHSVGVVESVGDNEESKQQVVEGTKVTVPGAETGNIQWTEEYRFYMCRHWSLYEAMYYSNYVSSKLEVWKPQGTVKLKEMLARLGIPLQQSQQSFNYMSPTLRNHFRRLLVESDIAVDYGLENPGVLFQSFFRYNSFKNPVSAADVVNAVNALLEMGGDEGMDLDLDGAPGDDQNLDSDETVQQNETIEHSPNWLHYFNKAYDCMSMRQSSELTLRKGISLALSLQKAIVGQGSTMLERNDAITRLKCFRYAFISRSAGGSSGQSKDGPDTGNDSMFGRPNVLTRLAHFIMDVQRTNGAWAGRKAKPLVLAAEKRTTFLVVGVVPIAHEGESSLESYPNRFRSYFKKAADATDALYRSDGFDTSVIEVGRDDINEFIESLMFVMTT